MKIRVWILLFFLFASFPCFAGKFYAIGFFSTNDKINPIARAGIQADFENFKSHARAIAAAIGYQLDTLCYTGSKFKIDNVSYMLSGLHISNDDIVFIYFDTHGYRYKDQKSPFPVALINDLQPDAIESYSVGFETLCNKILDKQPRLLVGIIDACNTSEFEAPPKEFENSWVLSIGNIDQQMNISDVRDLFLNYKGSVLVSSASPQELACGNEGGSQFTTRFFNAIDQNSTYGRTMSWENLLKSASEKTTDFANYVDSVKQHPYWDIKLVPTVRAGENILSASYALQLDEFEKTEKYAKQQFSAQRYKLALDYFERAHSAKLYDPFIKFYIFMCESTFDHPVYSTVNFNNLCQLLSDPKFENYIKGNDFSSVQYYIGISFLNNHDGCKKDWKKAKDWLKLSKKNGCKAADEILNRFR